jgi:hypothetical protein
MVCVTYIQQIYFCQHSFSYFIYLSYFVLKKTEIRVKPGHLQQIKKKLMSLSFSVKLHLYLTGNTLIHYGYFFLSVHKQSWVMYFPFLIAGRNLVTKTGLSGNQKRGGCTSS